MPVTGFPIRLTVDPGAWSVCRLAPDAAAGKHCFALVRTAAELSLVVPAGREPTGAKVEGPWRMLAVAGPIPFSETGVLNRITAPLARAAISIFAISSYDTDFVLVRSERLGDAVAALADAGLRVDR
ncbi:MAG: ACT domain-containing protein [Pseudomonadota bacterium]